MEIVSMNKTSLLACLALGMLLLAACASGGEDPLANTQWELVSMGPPGAETPVIAGSQVTLTFDAEGRVGGESGCNSYGGNYQVDGNAITFAEVASTLMACADQSVMDQEQRFFLALQNAGTFEISGDELAIQSADGQSVLNFTAAGQ
jgi:heat shock protein HslJ